MQLKTLSLATLGLLLLSSGRFVQAADSTNDLVARGEELSEEYLSLFDTEDGDSDFELLDDPVSSLAKRGNECAKYHKVSGSDSCVKLAKQYGITLNNIYDWNPQIKNGCPNLNNGKKYCVKMASSSDDSASDNSSSASGCSKTHKATGSDTCSKLSKANGISLNDFYKLNPSVDSSCSNLRTGRTYCVKGGSSKIVSLAAKKKSSSKKTTKKAAKKTTKKSAAKKETRRKLQSDSAFTYYWIAQPGDYTGGKKVAVKTCGGETIGSVAENYADALVMEGTGVVGSKIVNLGGCNCSGYKCFELVDKKSDPYGLTSYGTPLRPYVTIASNDIKKNTKIYVPALVGWKIPGSGKTHNGCLLVDDESWSFKGKHIDFYVYSMSNYETLDKQHRINDVDIYEGGSCKLLNYM